MPIDMPAARPAALFLLAHQDDEFGVFQAISDEVTLGRQVCCAYLTREPVRRGGMRHRNEESLAVLKQLGVAAADVYFAGDLLAMDDGCLPAHVRTAADWIRDWLLASQELAAVYVPAWEGGHPDHDALHAITASVALNLELLGRVRQFPLYNGYRCHGAWFRVLLPLPMNGATEERPIAWRSRLRFLVHCLSYPSQAKTWFGLFPFVFLHYLFFGTQSLQRVSLERLGQRPHDGALYYERRQFCTWEQMTRSLAGLEMAN